MFKLGIIGGSGLYNIEGLENEETLPVDTPYGSLSAGIIHGKLNDIDIYFVPRHGIDHSKPPHGINYRANIYALKSLGVNYVLSVSAVGSLKKEIAPGDLVLADQFIDRTKLDRGNTFFDVGAVAHVSLADPVCKEFSSFIKKAIDTLKYKVHNGGTYVCIEGPQFSTRAESNWYRSMGASIIGMTANPEYRLAREAQMHYAILALSTDYDCWKEDEEHVTADAVVEMMNNNVIKAKSVIKELTKIIAKKIEKDSDITKKCVCRTHLKTSIVTAPEIIYGDKEKMIDLLLK